MLYATLAVALAIGNLRSASAQPAAPPATFALDSIERVIGRWAGTLEDHATGESVPLELATTREGARASIAIQFTFGPMIRIGHADAIAFHGDSVTISATIEGAIANFSGRWMAPEWSGTFAITTPDGDMLTGRWRLAKAAPRAP